METGKFATELLLERLANLPHARKYWVGFSGGVDSTALLLALQDSVASLTTEFAAIHFNHGLHPRADSWQEHCRRFCEQKGIPFHARLLDLSQRHRVSAEEHARNERYRQIESILAEDEIYLTAHQADDNAETVFLNLMRGGGVDGLAGIPGLRKLGSGWVARPMLCFHRSELERFLRNRGVEWLEDPSNRQQHFDRNFVRHSVFPMLEKRWPGVIRRINQTARHAGEFSRNLERTLTSRFGRLLSDSFTMPLSPLLKLDPETQALIIRQWLRGQEIATPPRLRLNEFLQQIGQIRDAENHAELRWPGHLLKHHGGVLWLHKQPGPGVCPTVSWTEGACLTLGPGFGEMRLDHPSGPLPTGWQIGARKTGSRLRVKRSGTNRKVKELFRELGIPPWLRGSIPVLYWDGEVAALGDWLLSARLEDHLASAGTSLRWEPNDPLLRRLQSVSVQLPDRTSKT